MTDFDRDQLYTVFDEGVEAHEEGIVAVARYVEAQTLEKIASESSQVSVLAEVAHQLTRIANAQSKSAPVITAEQAVGQWPLKGGMYSHLAVGYLESLGIPVEIDPNS